MLLSMTGFGEARYHSDSLTVAVEIRAVNNRYLKIVVRAAEPYNLFEPELDKLIRKTIRRGTLQVHVRCERQSLAGDFRLNAVALRGYLEQIRRVGAEMGLDANSVAAISSQVIMLPGVAPEPGTALHQADEVWPILEKVLEEAVGRLQTMRQEEGRRMADELLALRDGIARELEEVRVRVPEVTRGYRERLLERVRSVVSEHPVSLQAEDVIREVAVFADRTDISEEVVRLASHLDQFRDVVLHDDDGPGRKMEFLVQEMGRETNTIGSKAGDVQMSRRVVAIKAILEKIRELIQNVE